MNIYQLSPPVKWERSETQKLDQDGAIHGAITFMNPP